MKPNGSSLSIVTLLFLFCCNTAMASKPIMTRMLGTQEFETKYEAVRALGKAFLAASIKEDIEHMGAILETPDGKFRVSHGKSTPGKDRFSFSVLRPAYLKVVAYWHTHGEPGPLREKFSVTDTKTVRKTGLPFYLITPSGEIKMLSIPQSGERRLIAQTISTKLENA